MRRLKIIVRCISNIFFYYPIDSVNPVDQDNIDDCVINIHCFLINAYGCMDNLAHIWVNENSVTYKNGDPLRRFDIGIRKKHEIVRKSLPVNLLRVVESMDRWFDYLEDYRGALAHRVPPYIPPYGVPNNKLELYMELDNKMNDCIESGDFEEYERLKKEKYKITTSQEILKHSFSERDDGLIFHPQILTDYLSICSVCSAFHSALAHTDETPIGADAVPPTGNSQPRR